MHLETARLVLRPLQAADATLLARMWADPAVTRTLGGPRAFEQVRASLEADARADPAPEFDLWPVVEKATGEIVGHCGIIDKDIDEQTEYELVYVFVPEAWGKGYATEIASALKRHAFEQLGLRRLVALIDPENAASERVALKLGMRRERDVLRPGGVTRRLYVTHAPGAQPARG